jgi:hypothetical protein
MAALWLRGCQTTKTDLDGVYTGQRYAADGTASGAEFKINTHTSSNQQYPSVTSLDDGGFVVTWMSDNQDGSGWGVYGQRYAADGTASGAEFKINTHTSSSQYNPSVTSLADNGVCGHVDGQ